MSSGIYFNGKDYAVDKHNYLINLEDWDDEIACHIASLEDISLSEEHWQVVRFIRQFYIHKPCCAYVS